MAKGDKKKVQNAIDYQGGIAQNNLENFRQNELLQNQADQNRYTRMADWTEQQLPQQMGMWTDFARTGGFSAEDLANIRARSVSPIRAMYSNALGNLQRQKALTGGYMPNFAPAYAKMMREQSANAADAATNAEAMIAELVQRGKLSGLSGMNQLFGTTPGAVSTFGNIRNATNAGLRQYQEMQNQLALGRMQAQRAAADVPGNFAQAMGNIGSVMGLAGAVMNPISAIFGGGGGNLRPGAYTSNPVGYGG